MLYQHYKGGLYRVLGEARHSETKEELVIYMSVSTGKFWARPKEMFYESISDGENIVPRFKKVDKNEFQ